MVPSDLTLLRPLRYVLIRHGAKVLYDGLLPLLVAAALTALLLAPAHPPAVFGKDGYLTGLQNLLTILGGFFVAALTLITTANLPILLAPVGGSSPPTMPGEGAPLSRKRFLAYLFGYLATSSFLLVALTLVANLIAPEVSQVAVGRTRFWLKGAFVLGFNFWLAHVFVATLLGMFYFTERLQMSDGRARVGKREAAPTAAE